MERSAAPPLGHTILLVDDDFETRYLVTTCLELEGYRVVTASNGREAMATLSREVPALLLVDLMMPVMDGVDLRRALQRQSSTARIPFVAFSGLSNGREVAVQLGADGFLEKPVNVEQLLSLLAQLLPPSK